MKRILFLFFLALGIAVQATLSAANWPAWRGDVAGSGITQEQNLPLRWSPTENVRWRVPLPDRGNSTPIVWGDRIFVTQAIEQENRRTLMCFARADGGLLWQSGVTYAEPETTHKTNPYCSASPVTDGERVIASFGSAGLFCYDFQGNEIWRRDLGKQVHEWGNAVSPILHRNLCILYFGPGPGSHIVAVDKASGKTVWQYDEPPAQFTSRTDGFANSRGAGVIGSWSTPIIVQAGGRDELVMSFPGEVRAFDPLTGQALWHCDGLNPLVYTSPIYGEGVVVAMGGFLGTSIAVRTGGKGDVTETHRLWQAVKTKNRLGSGVIHDGHIYILNTPGTIECIELKTGKVLWEERAPASGAKGESWSGMVLAGDRIYMLNQAGDTFVMKASTTFQPLALNTVKELTNSSLAVSNGEFFIRTHEHLWCIGASERISE